jgi:hypothetical protein
MHSRESDLYLNGGSEMRRVLTWRTHIGAAYRHRRVSLRRERFSRHVGADRVERDLQYLLANVAFRISARSAIWSDVLVWQVLGNLAGFALP